MMDNYMIRCPTCARALSFSKPMAAVKCECGTTVRIGEWCADCDQLAMHRTQPKVPPRQLCSDCLVKFREGELGPTSVQRAATKRQVINVTEQLLAIERSLRP